MRRKVLLYIGDELADLGDDTPIVMNYALTDLAEPTVVKNSYSQTVTLPGTRRNNQIFGYIYRLDRRAGTVGGGTGTEFDPSLRTPFRLIDSAGNLLESGYVKLNSFTRTGRQGATEYEVTLYGGLGSFFYTLSYDSSGCELSLADLTYLSTSESGDESSELTFDISAAAVTEAWARLAETEGDPPEEVASLWDVINFAPCYNGIPDDFDADRAIIKPAEYGLDESVEEDDVTYETVDGLALLNIAAGEMTEWEVRDLRSYLQRPVLSVTATLAAVARAAAANGYSFVYDDFIAAGTATEGMWMTLPLLPNLEGYSYREESLTLNIDSTHVSEGGLIPVTILDDDLADLPTGTELAITLHAKLTVTSATARAAGLSTLSLMRTWHTSGYTSEYGENAGWFVQLLAYDEDGDVITGSTVVVVGNASATSSELAYTLALDGETRADACGYEPTFTALDDLYSYTGCTLTKSTASSYQMSSEMTFSVTGYGIASLALRVTPYRWRKHIKYIYVLSVPVGRKTTRSAWLDDSDAMYAYNSTTAYAYTSFAAFAGDSEDTASYKTPDTVRSGQTITKELLLGGLDVSPAEWLLSLAKVYGFYFLYDKGSATVTLTNRNNLYIDETFDINEAIARDEGVTVTPLTFSSKWLDFELEGDGSECDEAYEDEYAVTYGMKRVDTGWNFDAEATDLMSSVILRRGVEACESGRYYCYLTTAEGLSVPAQWLDSGNTYVLWAGDGETTTEVSVAVPVSPTVEYFSRVDGLDGILGYDRLLGRKLQFHDDDGSPTDGTFVLVRLTRWLELEGYKLSDDSDDMVTLNDGTPCWDMTLPADDGALTVPIFGRYLEGEDGTTVEDSLDFGRPRELYAPLLSFPSDTPRTVYERYWQAYMADRYNVDTRVVECWVRFRGVSPQVSADLLRYFYWFDGCTWVLNEIEEYDITSDEPVKCEFVKVQARDNYTSGQSPALS